MNDMNFCLNSKIKENEKQQMVDKQKAIITEQQKEIDERHQVIDKLLIISTTVNSMCLIDSIKYVLDFYISKSGDVFWYGRYTNGFYMDYLHSVKFCEISNSTIAQIKNKEEYDGIVNMIRPTAAELVAAWTGIIFDPVKGEVSTKDSFIQWEDSSQPLTEYWNRRFVNVYLTVFADSNDIGGMSNTYPDDLLSFAICQW
uniref:uncharacterized protein LOC120333248 isoform X1 n=1 Tax=Styela clava TaxID=7725 RepID=UPI001939832D|nr:uncharacterized protein LOC120333248 isoform X1 [Styela clava]